MLHIHLRPPGTTYSGFGRDVLRVLETSTCAGPAPPADSETRTPTAYAD